MHKKGNGPLSWRTTASHCRDGEPWKDGCGFWVEKQQSQGEMTERMGTVQPGVDLWD